MMVVMMNMVSKLPQLLKIKKDQNGTVRNATRLLKIATTLGTSA
jgi:hypothetical protein